MQEQIDRESIAITVKASKLTGKVLLVVFRSVGRGIAKQYRAAQTPQGRQSIKKLRNHNADTSNIPLEGDTRLFDRVARKFKVDYSFHKLDKGKYLLLFKAGQADDIQKAFAEYNKRYMKRMQDKRPPVMEQFKKAAERAAVQKTQHKEQTRGREVVRNDR